MNTKILTLLLFVLLYQTGNICLGQESITHYENIKGKNSIIREYTDYKSIIYTHRSGDWGYFIFDSYGTGNNVSKAIKVDSLCRVYDFRIMDDTVFFCGKRGKYLIFGYFPVSYFNLTTASITNWEFKGGGKDSLLACKMDIYRNTDLINIAAVGQFKDSASSTNYSALFEFSIPDLNNLYNVQCLCYSNYNISPIFTDITVTNRYVVAVSNDITLGNCLLHPFKKTNTFVYSPLYPGNVFSISDVSPYGKILVEKYSNDSILIANHFSSTTLFGTTLKLLNIQNTYPYVFLSNSLLMPHSGTSSISSKWNMRELSANRQTKSAALLQDAETPFHSEAESTIFEYEIYNWNAMNIIATWEENVTFYSIYRRNGIAFQTIGYKPFYDPLNNQHHHIPIYRKAFYSTPTCALQYTPIPYFPNNPIISEYAFKGTVENLSINSGYYYNTSVISLNLYEDCFVQ